MRTSSSRSVRPARNVAAEVAGANARRSVQASCQRTAGACSRVSARSTRATIPFAFGASLHAERAVAARARTIGSASRSRRPSSGRASAAAPGFLAALLRQAASIAVTRTAGAASASRSATNLVSRGVLAAKRPYPYTARARSGTSCAAVAFFRSPAARGSPVLPSARAAHLASLDASAAVSSSENVRVLSSSANRRYPVCSSGAAETGARTPAAVTTPAMVRTARTLMHAVIQPTTLMGSLTLLSQVDFHPRGSPPLMSTPERKPGSGMSVREAGQKGGETVKKKYGPEFYEMIGRKGGQATKKAHGHAFYEAIGKKGGKKGGEATRDRYGPEFYETIGQKGGQKVKALIEQGKKAAAEAAEAEKKAS